MGIANHRVLQWLNTVANRRVHAMTNAIPFDRLDLEREHLQAANFNYAGRIIDMNTSKSDRQLPSRYCKDTPMIQHELSVYEQLLQEGVN